MTSTSLALSPTLSAAVYQQKLTDFLIAVEDTRLQPYVDTTGNPTIGWGFAMNRNAPTNILGAPTNAFQDYLLKTYFGFDPRNARDQYYANQIKATLDAAWPGDYHPDRVRIKGVRLELFSASPRFKSIHTPVPRMLCIRRGS